MLGVIHYWNMELIEWIFFSIGDRRNYNCKTEYILFGSSVLYSSSYRYQRISFIMCFLTLFLQFQNHSVIHCISQKFLPSAQLHFHVLLIYSKVPFLNHYHQFAKEWHLYDSIPWCCKYGDFNSPPSLLEPSWIRKKQAFCERSFSEAHLF